MTISTQKPVDPVLFGSIRSSRDRSLVAFGIALLTAAALHLGAFLPRLSSPEASTPSMAQTSSAPAAVVASEPVRSAPRG